MSSRRSNDNNNPSVTIQYKVPDAGPSAKEPPPGYGRGPSGTMAVEYRTDVPCPGCESTNDGTIQITYDIPDGIQCSYQKNPNTKYDGTKRRSYIPNTGEGRELAKRYMYAFLHGHMFHVGYSETFRKDSQVTWSSIPNKTSIKVPPKGKLPSPFGYPDPNYILKANIELDKLNIPTSDQLTSQGEVIQPPPPGSMGLQQHAAAAAAASDHDDEPTIIQYTMPDSIRGSKNPPAGYGIGPTGTMTVTIKRDLACPGYETPSNTSSKKSSTNKNIRNDRDNADDDDDDIYGGTIEIIYNIPNGIQQSYHPNPGVQYDGFARRRSYIPNTEDGHHLLTRYRYAFEHGYMFLVGKSVSSGKDNKVTWSTILNKTSLKSGPPFGFPDPNYIRNANHELDKLEIPSADELWNVELQTDTTVVAANLTPLSDLVPMKVPSQASTSSSAAPTPVAEGPATAPYLIPSGPPPPPTSVSSSIMDLDLSTLVSPKSWKLSAKEIKRCVPISLDNAIETKPLRHIQAPIVHSEMVVYVHCKDFDLNKILGDGSYRSNNNKVVISDLNGFKVTCRSLRSATLTRGTIHIKSLPFLKSGLFSRDRGLPNIKFSIFELRNVHCDENNVIVMTYSSPTSLQEHVAVDSSNMYELHHHAFYQTPEPSRLIIPLATAAVAAYATVPHWAIPINWSGTNLPILPSLPEKDYKDWIGLDGGLSSSMYAAALSYHVSHKVHIGKLKDGQRFVSRIISNQQPHPSSSSSVAAIMARQQYRHVDVVDLAKQLAGNIKHTNYTARMVPFLVEHCINALAFNLVVRNIKIVDFKIDGLNAPADRRMAVERFAYALAKLFLYNVTLREIDFTSTNLQGLGEIIGRSLAMNAQPLISRVNFCDCHLTGRDLRGLLPGLARIWCGGTAFAESWIFSGNISIPTTTWDLFFSTFVDPSSLPFWPQQPPPPPNLAFLQELDVSDTAAIGPGLARLSIKLTGLRSLKISSPVDGQKDNSSHISQVLYNLSAAKAPLQTFQGKNLSDSNTSAIFALGDTLKDVIFTGFRGNAAPLLCGWPQPTPELTVKFDGDLANATVGSSPSTGNSPGSLEIYNMSGFGERALRALSVQASGLENLEVFDMHYAQFCEAAPILAVCGLKSLRIIPATSPTYIQGREEFWSALAWSKTLETLHLPDQLRGGPDEIAMVGRFLKTNRSVKFIRFDSVYSKLNVESAKVLRSAFYGNKKVIELQYLQKIHQNTNSYVFAETRNQLQVVTNARADIKRLFKRHYSKYNRNWRAEPNRLKAPYVETIRVAKRKIGRMERESKKIATLLNEISNCVSSNLNQYRKFQTDKETSNLARREGELKSLALNKNGILVDLVTKLHKAKKRGRENKSAKTQLPRSSYYKSRNLWPNTVPPRHQAHVHSRYRSFNDPYNARYHQFFGFYSDINEQERNKYLDDNSPTAPFEFEMEPPVASNSSGSGKPGYDAPSSLSNYAAWASLISSVNGIVHEGLDPWADVDALLQTAHSDPNVVFTPDYLTEMHYASSELGVDVVSDVSRTLDKCSKWSTRMQKLAKVLDTTLEVIDTTLETMEIVDAVVDLAAVESTLGDIPDTQADTLDADDAVGMYAGAGPRDLDDGGPSFGDPGNCVVSGARRRARTRKINRATTRVRSMANRRLQNGYRNLAVASLSTCKTECLVEGDDAVWPKDLVSTWTDEVRTLQIKAMAESSLFELPAVSEHPPTVLVEGSSHQVNKKHQDPLDVTLVTQCSIDRLPNLEAQLAAWNGKASVAIYLKPEENDESTKEYIMTTIKQSKRLAQEEGRMIDRFDVTVAVVEGCIDDEQYPINFLRNVALLEARRQHLRLHSTLDNSAVLLVDVDFRPSCNLYETLHCPEAARAILNCRRVVVCPAFESIGCPDLTLSSLKDYVDNGDAEGFHLSHFPAGHGPTDFEKYWKESIKSGHNATASDLWRASYDIKYENLFEPYVVMATVDVPLYDERFTGYGLNKVSHLASVSKLKGHDSFVVLPGVFLVAPIHERSESWAKRYGSSWSSDETKFNQLWLKGLYHNFTGRLRDGKGPVVSDVTMSQTLLQNLYQQIMVSMAISRKSSTTTRYSTGRETVSRNTDGYNMSHLKV